MVKTDIIDNKDYVIISTLVRWFLDKIHVNTSFSIFESFVVYLPICVM